MMAAKKHKSYATTAEVAVPKQLIEQVIGQKNAVEIIRKAALQKRNVLLIGSPGTGKSLLAQAMAELLPVTQLEDIIVTANASDENQPKIKVVKAGDGRKMVDSERMRVSIPAANMNLLVIAFLFLSSFFLLSFGRQQFGDVITAALLIGLFLITGMVVFASQIGRKGIFSALGGDSMKLLVDNAGKKKAPFVDSTSARAGALFGDCRHDPLQSFFHATVVTKMGARGATEFVSLGELANNFLEENKAQIVRNADGYEAVAIPVEKQISVLGFKDGKVCPVKVLSVNRYPFSGKLSNVRSGGSRLTVTQGHKVFNGSEFVDASSLADEKAFHAGAQTIVDEEQILCAFSKQEQEYARSYYAFLKLHEQMPTVGYKKAARLLKIPAGRTRWWYKNAKPRAVQTIDWLKQRGLLPLYSSDKRLPLIAAITGCTFGDGGIAGNLNNLFLSSSEESSLAEFKNDLIGIFGEEIENNFDIISSGVNGTGRCIRNTNRAVVRLFVALGAPIGRKDKSIEIPPWIYLSDKTARAFFAAYAGNELCSPKFREEHHSLTSLDLAICGKYGLRENRIKFLRELERILNSYGVYCNPICESTFRSHYMWRLCIRKDVENLWRFMRYFPLKYSREKQGRLAVAFMKQFECKRQSLAKMEADGKSQKYIAATLHASQQMLQQIREDTLVMDDDDKEVFYEGMLYNITTESGNLFANGILAKNSGGLGTPAHLRIEAGNIHRANGGVLFIDEVATLSPRSQQELLTAMQEKKYSITGQSEMSSGALVKSEPVPCNFVLVASGNYADLKRMHPALRSRIRGYGYEVYMEENIDDNAENREKLYQFVAQEVIKDGKIPHFAREAVEELIGEARKRSGRKKKLTLKLRELGGLVRSAGDLAKERNHEFVSLQDVLDARRLSRTLEEQVARQIIEHRKDYQVFLTRGSSNGKVNGLAVMGDAGIVLPIVAEYAPSSSRNEGRIIATGKLGSIAKEAVENVSAIIKKHFGKDISSLDIHVQFLQTYEGVEGDSASVSVATAVISALENVAVDQSVALTGSLSVRGEVLPVGGVTQKIEAAIEAGMKTVLIPKSNAADVALPKQTLAKIKIIPVHNLFDVLKHSLKEGKKKNALLSKIKTEFAG